jgi:SAM-dependent methyltransferase
MARYSQALTSSMGSGTCESLFDASYYRSSVIPQREQYLSRLRFESEQDHLAFHANCEYASYHKERFEYLLEKCIELRPDRNTKVLDVGRSELSYILSGYYNNVTTVGFPLVEKEAGDTKDSIGGENAFNGHIVYDLNWAQELKPIDTEQRFSLIVFAEVIEHLHTAPELTLYVLAELLEPGGHIIIQTPNATTVHKRVKLMLGWHPYERIRINKTGHYREYTKRELIEVVQAVGLEVICHEFRDYFVARGSPVWKAGTYLNKWLSRVVPQFARGQTLVAIRPK